MRRACLMLCLMLGVAIGAIAASPPASGAAVRIGSDLAPDPVDSIACTNACTKTNTANPGEQITSPIGGVVVRWRLRGSAGLAQPVDFRLRVLRPNASGTAHTAISSSAIRTVSQTSLATHVFPTRQVIAAGDAIGLDVGSPAGNFVAQTAPQAGVGMALWMPPIGNGEALPTDPFEPADEILVNADVEPDADCDGFGDETQDAAISGGCLPSPPSEAISNEFEFGKPKKNRRKGTAKLPVDVPGAGEVELARTKKVKGASTRAEAAGPVTIAVKPKGRTRRKLDETGRAKVKAEVTFAPDGGEPNTVAKRIGLRKRV